jgi:hypothetical protein
MHDVGFNGNTLWPTLDLVEDTVRRSDTLKISWHRFGPITVLKRSSIGLRSLLLLFTSALGNTKVQLALQHTVPHFFSYMCRCYSYVGMHSHPPTNAVREIRILRQSIMLLSVRT